MGKLISIAEYAKMHGIHIDSVRQGIHRGKYKTAQKIGRNWAIDEDEPLIDRRKKKEE